MRLDALQEQIMELQDLAELPAIIDEVELVKADLEMIAKELQDNLSVYQGALPPGEADEILADIKEQIEGVNGGIAAFSEVESIEEYEAAVFMIFGYGILEEAQIIGEEAAIAMEGLIAWLFGEEDHEKVAEIVADAEELKISFQELLGMIQEAPLDQLDIPQEDLADIQSKIPELEHAIAALTGIIGALADVDSPESFLAAKVGITMANLPDSIPEEALPSFQSGVAAMLTTQKAIFDFLFDVFENYDAIVADLTAKKEAVEAVIALIDEAGLQEEVGAYEGLMMAREGLAGVLVVLSTVTDEESFIAAQAIVEGMMNDEGGDDGEDGPTPVFIEFAGDREDQSMDNVGPGLYQKSLELGVETVHMIAYAEQTESFTAYYGGQQEGDMLVLDEVYIGAVGITTVGFESTAESTYTICIDARVIEAPGLWITSGDVDCEFAMPEDMETL
jgi:hypothetical protein